MRIIFHSNQLSIRGTEVALYDMADYTESLLGYQSYIAAPFNSDMGAYEKFKERFGDRIYLYSDFSSLETFCSENDIKYAYLIKGGKNDGKIINGVKNFIHCVFTGDDPHGDVYAAVSKWLGEKYNIDYLPHIVNLPKIDYDYREYLGISKEAKVFGRYGGYDQFDVPYLSEVIYNAADSGMYFLLMNTAHLYREHPNIIYLDSTTDLSVKTSFINTCDAMLHGRTEGESFGLAIAEFLHQNKPVITNIDCRDRNHIFTMGDKGIYYSSAKELHAIIHTFEKKDYDVKYLVEPFTADVIIKKFKDIFL